MKFSKSEKGYMIRLLKGEKIIESLTHLCKQEGIYSATLTGLGGAMNAEIGHYDLDNKTYNFKNFDGPLEIVSCNGNVAKVDEVPFIHMHMTISDSTLQCFGGHVKELVVGATCEIFLTPLEIDLTRSQDDEIGLKLLNCEVSL